MTGHFRIVCARGGDGRDYVREQSFSAPMHMSKPHWQDGVLVVNAINATAGLFSGDSIVWEADVEAGASLLLTSPAAQRAHRMPAGEARMEQHFGVRAGGWLEVWPELFIPQRGARYWQKTAIEVEAAGELLFFEMMAPGRVASGEVFCYDSLEWETEVRYGGALVAREKAALRPGDESLFSLNALFPGAYYASCFAIGPSFFKDGGCWEKIDALNNPSASVGCSSLVAGGSVVRILARTGPDLRRVLACLRGLLYAAAGRATPILRRP